VWAVLLLGLALVWRAGSSRLSPPTLGIVCALLLWMVGRTLLKPHPDVEIEVLVTWLLPVILFIAATSLNPSVGVRPLALTLAAVAAVQCVLMVLQRYGIDPLFPQTTAAMAYRPARMVGTVGYQNQAADLVAVCCATVFLPILKPLTRAGLGLAAFVVVGMTGNRGGILAFLCAAVFALAIAAWGNSAWIRSRKVAATMVCAAAVLGLFAILALLPETGARFRQVVRESTDAPAVASRLHMARIGAQMIRERPLTGWGAGEYAFQYLDRMRATLPEEKTHHVLQRIVFAREAHNDPLQFTAEFGAIGFILLAALLVAMTTNLCRASDAEADSEPTSDSSRRLLPWVRRGPAIALLLVYMTVSSLVSFPWQASLSGPLAGLLLGWLWPETRRSSCSLSRPIPKARRIAGAGAKATLVIVSVAIAAVSAGDAFLDVAIPDRIARLGPVGAEGILLPCAYRYQALVGAGYAVRGSHADAVRLLANAQKGYRDVTLLNNRAHAFAKTGNWAAARDIYLEWAQTGLDYSNALNNLSIAYEQTGQYGEASASLARKLSLWSCPVLEDVKRLVVLRIKAGEPHRALATLQDHEPRWRNADSRAAAEMENLAGATHLMLGQTEQAAERFRSALRLDPTLQSARKNLERLNSQREPR
jgi:O-antigen ligase